MKKETANWIIIVLLAIQIFCVVYVLPKRIIIEQKEEIKRAFEPREKDKAEAIKEVEDAYNEAKSHAKEDSLAKVAAEKEMMSKNR